MRKLMQFVLVLMLCTWYGFSQSTPTDKLPTTSKKWIAKLGINMVRSAGDGSVLGSFEENAFAEPLSLGIEYKLNDHFSVGLLQSFNKWKADKGILDGVLLTEDQSYFSLDASLKFYFDDYLVDADWLNLYLDGGVGYFSERDSSVSGNIGLGGILWVSESVGFNLQGMAKFAGKNNIPTNHIQYFAGIVYNFGGVDTDKDGILDKEDHCPEQFGLAQFNGCPDSDNDGVEESIDECPLKAGPKELNGCPDKDNDGVADKNDECPDVPGNKMTRGCPDKDNDGVPDKFDKCPELQGAIKNYGCPWKDTDKDGVLDKDDKCPYQIGPAANNGCPYPKLTQKEEDIIDAYAATILFDFGKAILKPESKATLDKVAVIMKKFGDEKFYVNGHTDNSYTETYNLKLSLNRANAVKDYLVSKGIDALRLTTKGFGESKPVFDNTTEEGRRKNRRVEIVLVK